MRAPAIATFVAAVAAIALALPAPVASQAAPDAYRGAGGKFLPNRTFRDTLSLQFKTKGDKEGTNRVDLYYFGRARTDGDIVVVLPSFGIALLGELLPARAAPAIDTARGG